LLVAAAKILTIKVGTPIHPTHKPRQSALFVPATNNLAKVDFLQTNTHFATLFF
jgi:hypothetical protein